MGLTPASTAVAVYVIISPEHCGVADGATLILTGILGDTDMLIVLEVAGFPVLQDAFDVSMQYTLSPFTGTYENTELLIPALPPFTFQR